MTDRIVILAAGRGTRMQRDDDTVTLDPDQAAMAEAGIKALIPIQRPFLDYVLTSVADAGYRRVCLVVGPAHRELRDYYRSLDLSRLDVQFAVQPTPEGTAHALACAADCVGTAPFGMINSDNWYPVAALRSLRDLAGPGLVAFSRNGLLRRGNMGAERIASYAVVEVDQRRRLIRIVEKPGPDHQASRTADTWISMNCWRFGPEIFTACRSIDRSPRNELEIADAVNYGIGCLDQRFQVVFSEEGVLDLSRRGDIAAVARRLRGMEVRL